MADARTLGAHLQQNSVCVQGQVHGLIVTSTHEAEVMLRDGRRRCPRLVAARHHQWQPPVHMHVARFGSIEEVHVLDQPIQELPPLGDGEVELRVRAVTCATCTFDVGVAKSEPAWHIPDFSAMPSSPPS